jgi:hypothetical protein
MHKEERAGSILESNGGRYYFDRFVQSGHDAIIVIVVIHIEA